MKLMIVVLAFFFLIAFGLAYISPSSLAESPQKEIATPVQEGVISERQKEHSKLYKEFHTDQNIPKLTRAGSGDIEVRKIIYPPLGGGVPCSPPCDTYPHAYLKGIAYDADAVVIGQVKNKTSQLTEDEDFVFTDYELIVEEVLKDNPAGSIQRGSTIIITRPGGVIQLNSRIIRGIDTSFDSFDTSGRYILFLRFIPTTGTYRAFSNGSFHLHNDRVIKLTNATLWEQLQGGDNATSFLTEVRNAITSVRSEEPKGYVKLN